MAGNYPNRWSSPGDQSNRPPGNPARPSRNEFWQPYAGASGGSGQYGTGGNFGHQGQAVGYGQQGAGGNFGQQGQGGAFNQQGAEGGFGHQGQGGPFGQQGAVGGFGQHPGGQPISALNAYAAPFEPVFRPAPQPTPRYHPGAAFQPGAVPNPVWSNPEQLRQEGPFGSQQDAHGLDPREHFVPRDLVESATNVPVGDTDVEIEFFTLRTDDEFETREHILSPKAFADDRSPFINRLPLVILARRLLGAHARGGSVKLLQENIKYVRHGSPRYYELETLISNLSGNFERSRYCRTIATLVHELEVMSQQWAAGRRINFGDCFLKQKHMATLIHFLGQPTW